MSRKRYTPEQIIGFLRETEVALAQGEKRLGRFVAGLGFPNRTTTAGAVSTAD